MENKDADEKAGDEDHRDANDERAVEASAGDGRGCTIVLEAGVACRGTLQDHLLEVHSRVCKLGWEGRAKAGVAHILERQIGAVGRAIF